MQKCYGTTNSPNHRCFLCSVQRMDLSQLTSYDVIFGCVDNLEARFYINSVVLQCKDKTIVYIDGGSMGLGGQAQLIIPHVLLVVSHQEGDSLLPLSLLSVSRPRNRAVSSLYHRLASHSSRALYHVREADPLGEGAAERTLRPRRSRLYSLDNGMGDRTRSSIRNQRNHDGTDQGRQGRESRRSESFITPSSHIPKRTIALPPS